MKNQNRYNDEDRVGRIITMPPYQFHGYSVLLVPNAIGFGKVDLWWDKEFDIEIRPASKNTCHCIVEGKPLTAGGVPRRFFSMQEVVAALAAAA